MFSRKMEKWNIFWPSSSLIKKNQSFFFVMSQKMLYIFRTFFWILYDKNWQQWVLFLPPPTPLFFFAEYIKKKPIANYRHSKRNKVTKKFERNTVFSKVGGTQLTPPLTPSKLFWGFFKNESLECFQEDIFF